MGTVNLNSSKMFVLLLLPALATAISSDNFIVNGQNVNIANYPWQGSYRTGTGSHTCGCVFLGSTWTLTAGHCGGSSAYTAGYGSSTRTSVTPFSISSVTRHPSYGVGSGFTPNDFSVVRTASTPSGSNISPGTIASSSSNPGGNGAITGWGRTCGSCGLPSALQGVDPMPIISDSECTSRWGSSFNSNLMICVYNGSQGSCNGDSGGPLSVGSTIYGVTSWGVSGCGTNYPSVYAKVGAVRSWICSTTSNGAQGC